MPGGRVLGQEALEAELAEESGARGVRLKPREGELGERVGGLQFAGVFELSFAPCLRARKFALLRRVRCDYPFTGMHRREAIQQYTEAIAREFHPEKIILFGSHAYGQVTEDSDVDLMVVMPFRGSAIEQSFRIRNRLEHPGFPIDLLVRSPREIAKREAMGDFFIREILDRGKVLYASGHS